MTRVPFTEQYLSKLRSSRAQQEVYDSGFSFRGSFGVRLGKNDRKMFFLIYSLHGKRKRITIGPHPRFSLSDAHRRACEFLAEVELGRDPAAAAQKYRMSLGFSKFGERFIDHCSNTGRKETTVREYRRILAKEIRPIWGDRKLQDISTLDVNQLLDSIATGRNSPVMAQRTKALISSLFSYAMASGLINENPVQLAVSAKGPIPATPKNLQLVQLHRLHRAAALEQPITRAIFEILLLTGQPPGRVTAMRWSELSLDHWIFDSNSKDTQFQLYLTPEARNALRLVQENGPTGDWVFSLNKDRPVSNIRKAARRIGERAGIEKLSPLDIRRSFPSNLRQLGVRPDVIDTIFYRRTHSAPDHYFAGSAIGYDYSFDIRQALLAWSRAIVSGKPPEPTIGRTALLSEQRGVVVDLFAK